jgi:DNA-binding CsgD family transcriptional regulator
MQSTMSVLTNLGERLYKFRNDIDVDKSIFTKREKEIIIEMAEGLTSDEISSKLFISKNTVDTHRKNIYRKGKFKSLRDVILFSFFL